MRIGAHVSVSGGVEKAIEREEDVGGNCGQIFAGSPRTWSVAEYDDEDVEAFREARAEAGQSPYAVHSTYLVNLATPKDDLMEDSVDCLQQELYAAHALGAEYVVFHPGAHTGSGVESGLDRIADGVDALEIPDGTTLLFENTAGKGTTLGKEFSQLREMLDRTETPNDDLGVCIDTCHAHAGGYDLADGFDGVLEELDAELGLEHVELLHLNDSKDPLGSEKDNHEHIGEGEISDEGFRNVVNADEFEELPMVLETPTSDGKSYEENIERVRSLVRDPSEEDYAAEIRDGFGCSEGTASLVAEKAVGAIQEYEGVDAKPEELVELLRESEEGSVEERWNELCGHWEFVSEPENKGEYKI